LPSHAIDAKLPDIFAWTLLTYRALGILGGGANWLVSALPPHRKSLPHKLFGTMKAPGIPGPDAS
jgi:hypothetical protein